MAAPLRVALLSSLTPALAAEIIRIRASGRTSRAWGLGQVIVTFLAGGWRIVAVDEIYYALDLTVTVHDFLLNLMRNILGAEWGIAELEKPYTDRHPILQWHDDNATFWCQRRKDIPNGIPIRVRPTGRMSALYSTAYDLFTVANNKLLDHKLLHRIRNKDQFQGARYELYVRAFLLRAGFNIVLEDEAPRDERHFELTATSKRSGCSFSVEAKSRGRAGRLGRPGQAESEESLQLDFGHLLSDALAKPARDERLVFIDVNLPPSDPGQTVPSWFKRMDTIVSAKESLKLEGGARLPACYLILTNHPYHYGDSETEAPNARVVITGFNIPGYRKLSREQQWAKYPIIEELVQGGLNSNIPPTFPEH